MEKIIDISTGVYKETVVRCKDCKHSRPIEGVSVGVECYHGMLESESFGVMNDDFCSYGEVRDE